MIVYRLTKTQFAEDLSGEGARIAGGRWNTKGNAVLYTASSRSLCLNELLVNIPGGVFPERYSMVKIFVPDIIIRQIHADQLPKHWNAFPHANITCRMGDDIYQEKHFPVLRVPSAVIPQEYNYILFPKHPMFEQVFIAEIETFSFDSRLF